MRRRAFTLLELIVTIAVIGVLSTMAVLSARPARGRPEEVTRLRIDSLRARALRSGRPATVTIIVAGAPMLATAFPNGMVVGDSALQLNWLNGRAANDSQ